MHTDQILVAIDIGARQHRVAIAGPHGQMLEEFDLAHTAPGFRDFFARVGTHEQHLKLPVAIAMEGFNGHARPLDTQIRIRGYALYNVNNLKLARFKEIFPGPAKTDPIDTRKILELFSLRTHLPLAKGVLQEVRPTPSENEQIKRLTRRRRQLVNEKGRVLNRLQADLRAVSPGLLEITGDADNLWFLRLLSCRETLPKLARLRRGGLLKIKGVGAKYADIIQGWQKEAQFAPEVEWVGEMILEDARRILELKERIARLEEKTAAIAERSEIARRIGSIPGFGATSSAELAGEIGTLERFSSEASLALYVGMAALDNRSGNFIGTRSPRQVNTRAKAAKMVAVARHIDNVPNSRAYYEKKRAQGKKHNQAVRALGRHLVRVIWSMIKHQRDYELR